MQSDKPPDNYRPNYAMIYQRNATALNIHTERSCGIVRVSLFFMDIPRRDFRRGDLSTGELSRCNSLRQPNELISVITARAFLPFVQRAFSLLGAPESPFRWLTIPTPPDFYPRTIDGVMRASDGKKNNPLRADRE